MNTTTITNECPKCDGRGIIHVTEWTKDGYPMFTRIDQCNCRPPEYWAERSKKRWDELMQLLADHKVRVENGKENAENTGR